LLFTVSMFMTVILTGSAGVGVAVGPVDGVGVAALHALRMDNANPMQRTRQSSFVIRLPVLGMIDTLLFFLYSAIPAKYHPTP
jgi:hypothetical protein